ncbi:MAG TPA: hypothetical protein VJW51_13240 [Candidatus Acidoferrales bacterium]|nr:hypothetical protein [Candidatus Acidoferrales bacterium]
MMKPSFALLFAGAICAAGWLSAAAAQATPPSSSASGAQAASQEPSLADAARKARADKKSEPPAKHVWNDENLPKDPRAIPAATGEGGEQPAAEAAAKPAEANPAAADDDKKKAELEAKWREKFANAQKKLDNDQKDLDLMERELGLARTQYSNDPNTAMRDQYQRDSGSGGKVNDLVKKIDDKKQEVEKDKQTISDLEDQLRKDGLPSGWSRP